MAFKAQRQSMKAITIPAPIKGVDARQTMSVMDPLNCVYAYNIMPKHFGLTTRQGYAEWANGVTGADGVRTMMAFVGLAEDESQDRLFAATSEGIFDVSTDGETAPVQVVTWPVQGANAGLCIFVQITTAAGAYLLITDGDNGYYTYEGSTGIWTEVPDGGGGVTGPGNPRNFAFVTIWKNRVWFVESSSGSAWYLPVGDFLGSATEFEFGNKFRFGGWLKGLWNWTLDGGDGVDDYLVAVSEGGDVVVYRGTDPAQASSFDQVGSWFIGAMPFGRRVASDFGGDLFVLSSYGVTSMTDLMTGTSRYDESNYVTSSIAPYIRRIMDTSRQLQGWEINIHPREGTLIIDTPSIAGQPPIQFVMNFGTNAWAFWRDVPLATMVPYHGNLYFGSQDENSIWQFTGDADRVYLDQDANPAPIAINWSLLSAYSDFGAPATNKVMQLMRPVFVSEALPVFEIQARFDFDISEATIGPVGPINVTSGVWDVSVWDQAIWGGGNVSADNPVGATGIGRYVAYALRGSSSNATTLVTTDMNYTVGGYL